MQQITLKQLRYFVAASESSNISKASRQLHITQPSISAAIAHIESVAGVPLLVRHVTQGISLTHEGRAFFARAKSILNQTDDLMTFVSSLKKEISGPLKMAAFETFTHVTGSEVMKSFNHIYPNVSLHYEVQHQEGIIDGLRKRTYDLCLGYDMEVPEDLLFTELSQHPPYVAVDINHPLAEKEEVSFAELSEYPMVLLNWPISRDYFISLFRNAGYEPRIAHYVSSISMARELAAQGFGFTIFNISLDQSSKTSNQNLKAIKIKDPVSALKVGILRLRNIETGPVTNAMIHFLMDQKNHRELSQHPQKVRYE